MNCREWEERVALYAGGDLGTEAAVAVERHLGDCAGCQKFASGLRRALETLQAEHAEPIATAHYAAVRTRVMAELRPRRRWGWVWLLAAATALTVGVGIERGWRVAELPTVALRAPVAPAMGYSIPAKVIVAERLRRQPALPRKPIKREELLVKIETEDPDVVIYWITETKGDY